MTLAEWIAYHDKRSLKRCDINGRERLHPLNCDIPQQQWTDEKHGAIQFFIQGDVLYLTGIVGTMKFWEEKLIPYCKENNVKKIIGFTCSNKPKAVARLFKMQVTQEWFELERLVK